MVKATMIGVAKMNCPITMAFGVNRSSRGPRGPCREMREYSKSPTTTVGRAMRVLNMAVSPFLPQNSLLPMIKPTGTPTKEERKVAMVETLKESKAILKISLSKENINPRAFHMPPKIYSISYTPIED
jgi:hypothetical protein